MRKTFKKIQSTLGKIKEYAANKFRKINIKNLIPRNYRKKESDKQHGFTFRNEKHKGKRF